MADIKNSKTSQCFSNESNHQTKTSSSEFATSPGGGGGGAIQLPQTITTTNSSIVPMDTPRSQEWRLDWDTKMDIALFNAVMKIRPVGIHKHFRMIYIHREYNALSPVKCTIQQLWDRLNFFFDLEQLDEMEFEFEGGEGDSDDRSIKEFSLPMDDYDQLIAEYRKANSSRSVESPPSITSITTTTANMKGQKGGKKELAQSPTSTTRSTASSSPEPEEPPPKKSRRTSRPPKKVETTAETPAPKTPVKRGRGRRPSDRGCPEDSVWEHIP
ncbi:7627_t:CDS:2 [Ambispora gerdemannii]|uniref:7627_t:CDS:1 n=1 Tax=Ambispora gerdemannii TaxID=144530 RepID=A0A9N8V490_9GLOM|nr:7627_t:CDS:2 [Ambispora gerdemannii]